jgi:endo-1,4-beta-D-glucanase Y
MLACRPRLVRRVGFSSPAIVASIVMLALATGCGPGAAGGGGAAGTSGTAGSAGGLGGTGGSSSGAGGSAGGQAGATAGGGAGGGAGSAGSAGNAGNAGSAGSNGGAAAGASGAGGNAGSAGTGGGSAGRGGSAGATAGSGGGSGTGGAGAGGAGGTVVATTCNAGPPSAPSGGASFPFPQHRASSSCIYPPTCSDADAMAGWAAYKTALIVADGTDGSMRVHRDGGSSGDTVSEGIAYGMLFAVYMNDKTTFDALWKYEQKHLDTTGLMNWQINADGTTPGHNSATDADEDMAFALVMADKQWGGYSTTAMNMLMTVSTNDFATDGTIKGGDKYANAVNPSYLAPAFYKVFAAYSGDTRWTTILNKSYMLLASAQNATTGLVPDWSMGPGTNASYGYDATRTPFRVALDVCWNGDANAMAFSQKIGAFFAGIGVANIGDQYTVATGAKTSPNNNSTFIGPAGAAGMASNQAKLVADAYARVAADAKAANTNYYDRSWALFTTLLMTGNFLNFQSP